MGREVPTMSSIGRWRQAFGVLVQAGKFENNLKLERGSELTPARTDGELGQGTDAAAARSPVDLRPPSRLCRKKYTKAHFLLASRFPK